MINFQNTEIAFSGKTNQELKKSLRLFKMIGKPLLVKIGNPLLSFANAIHFPIRWIVKPTIFSHFCGGETIEECEKTIQKLASKNVGTILDYSAEGQDDEESFEHTKTQLLQIIRKAKGNNNIPFSVFKTTGLARLALLEKVNAKEKLTENEITEFENIKKRIHEIGSLAHQLDVPIFIDAEETWIQNPIDGIALEMMRTYNKEKTIIYNTIQMYRHDRFDYLKEINEIAETENFHLGFKIVRGAYMEKERERALKQNYPSPIYESKEKTDQAYNESLSFCLEHIDRIAVCAGTHNEESSAHLVNLLEKAKLPNDFHKVYFSQLLGMSDHISYNLSALNYNVVKYVPFGPIKSVLPYLIRRAEENTSIAGQTGRELMLLKTEIKRRKGL
jgi:proline dehydrogenase